MRSKSTPKTLILATSYAPELRKPQYRPKEYPRTDYVELSKFLDSDIIDYSIYDGSNKWARYRSFEKRLRLDFHLALTGFRRARDYDVVLLMSERVAIPYMLLQKGCKRRSHAVYVSAHSSDKQAKLVRSMRLFESLAIAVSNTHGQRDFFVKGMGIPEDRIRYVMYAVDEQFFVPMPTERYLFSAGGIAGRDYITLVEAMKGLPWTIKIAAGGRDYGLGASRPLPPLPSNVEMLSPVDSAGMRRLYQSAAAVIVPLSRSRQDAAGCSVVLEAMCCGKPVIASRTKGMLDYIRHADTGVLIDPEDPEALRNSIKSMMEDSEQRSELGCRARAECENRLSLRELVKGLQSALEDACCMDHRSYS